ncbi:hypothetical protein [Janibacter sp. GXQ6167]|uniref:hypothetical protein n=1 Tax=Janibacter sp. GXQ6167 TaxID=3240791 RepID=UPI00352329CA
MPEQGSRLFDSAEVADQFRMIWEILRNGYLVARSRELRIEPVAEERSGRVDLVLTSRGPQVVIEGFEVEVVARAASSTGEPGALSVSDDPEVPDGAVLIGFDLSDDRTRCLRGAQGHLDWSAHRLEGEAVDLEAESSLPLTVLTRVASGTVDWRLIVHYSVLGKPKRQVSPAGGATWRTSAPTPPR